MERDDKRTKQARYKHISTHTLTWSVTPYSQLSVKMSDFNSHAHVERDFYASGLTNEQLNFNSHAHVERDVQW